MQEETKKMEMRESLIMERNEAEGGRQIKRGGTVSLSCLLAPCPAGVFSAVSNLFFTP